MEELLKGLNTMYPHSNFQIVEDDNDENSYIIYTDNYELVEDDAETLSVIDYGMSLIDCDNLTLVYELEENMYLD